MTAKKKARAKPKAKVVKVKVPAVLLEPVFRALPPDPVTAARYDLVPVDGAGNEVGLPPLPVPRTALRRFLDHFRA